MKRYVLSSVAFVAFVAAALALRGRPAEPYDVDDATDLIDADGDGAPFGERDPAEYADGVALYWIGALPPGTDPYYAEYTMCGHTNEGGSIEIPGDKLFDPKGDVFGFGFWIGELPVDLHVDRIVLWSKCS